MKKNILIVAFLFSLMNVSAQYAHQNITYLSNFNDTTVPAEPNYGIRYQSCWGWVDPEDNREYGVIGSTEGTYIIDETDPLNPVEKRYISHHATDLIWHEFKTYNQYLYIISDGPQANSLQIVDMSYLPDSVHLVYDSDALFTNAHTIYIEGDKMYLGSVSETNGLRSMGVYSLADPESPVLLRYLDDDYPAINVVHDMNVSNDTIYASCGNDGLYIFTYDSVANVFTQIGSLLTYPDQGYNHSSVLSKDRTTMYMCDEVPAGMAVKVIDVTDIANPTVIDTFRTNIGDTPHNPYVQDDMLVIAAYLDGVYTYDISQPGNPMLSGFFDSHPQNGTDYSGNAYAGCWAAYTKLPSGILLISDMQYGLFALDKSQALLVHQNMNNSFTGIKIFPNPVQGTMNLKLGNVSGNVTFQLYDMTGRELMSVEKNNYSGETVSLDVAAPAEGIYFLRAVTDAKTYTGMVNVVR